MSVIVKGMKMPKNCDKCHFYRYWDEMASSCRAFNKTKWIDDCDMKKERHPDCPLIEVPKHGDLIDRDMVLEKAWDVETFVDAVKYAPTIIPAEEGET